MTELTDRMRTCAARILDLKNQGGLAEPHTIEFASHHAADLLVEAADTLEAAEVDTVAMDTQTAIALDVIPPHPPPSAKPIQTMAGVWYDSGPTEHVASRNACPNCDSRAHKTVRAIGGRLELECPVCGARWKR